MISCDLHAVVVSDDASVLGVLLGWLRNMGIRTSVFSNPAPVLQAITRQRVDAVFVDWDIDRDCSLLRAVRATPTGRKLIGMTIISQLSSVRNAFRYSDFVLEKPFLPQRVAQTLRAAHGMMVRDRMQYSRIPLHSDASVFDSHARNCSAVATNVSQTGIALECGANFQPGEVVQIRFRVPESSKSITCKAKVIWTDHRTKAGFAFLEMKVSDKEALSLWIENQFIEGWQQRTVFPLQAPSAASVSGLSA